MAGSYFRFTLAPGESTEDAAVVSNSSGEDLMLSLYVADGVTASGGGTTFAERDRVHSGDGAWVSIASSEVLLPAGGRETIGLRVTVPTDARAGDHVAGVVAEAPPKPGRAGAVQTTITERAGVAVVVHVPGPAVSKIVLGSVCLNQASGSNYFEFSVRNAGNVLERGEGRFLLEAADGQHVFQRPFELGSVIPGDKTPIRVHAPQYAPSGKYIARVRLETDGRTPVASESALAVPKEMVDGCSSARASGFPADGEERDNFNISEPGTGSANEQSWWLIGSLLLLIAVAALAGWALGRRWENRPKGAR